MRHRAAPQTSAVVLLALAFELSAPVLPIAWAEEAAPIPSNRTPPPKSLAIPGVPDRPSAPPELKPQKPGTTFRCDRAFRFDGKIYSCDSMVRQDGEGLRAFVKDTPAAIAELDNYQYNRRVVRNAAYVGTLGLAIAGAGAFFKDQVGIQSEVTRWAWKVNFTLVGGLLIAASSLIYGYTRMQANESHLNNAVDLHNQAYPAKPIDLVIGTSIPF